MSRTGGAGRFTAAVAGLVLFSAGPASAVTGPPQGEVVPSVVALGTLPVACGADFAPRCSGVVVAPRYVLTAAHCVDPPALGQRLEVLVPGNDPSAGIGDVVDIVDVFLHPSFVDGNPSWDVAIVSLGRPVSVPPAVLSEEGADLAPGSALVVGFGASTAGGSPASTRRAGTVDIDAVTDRAAHFIPAPNMPCDGDSGGALMVHRGAEVELAGIVAEADAACSQWGQAARVDLGLMRELLSLAGDAGPVTAVASDAYRHLCASTCEVDGDCPAGTSCVPVSGQRAQCVVDGLLPGEIAGPCIDEASCDECVQTLEPGAPCRCYRYCAALIGAPVATPSNGAGGPTGCALSGLRGEHPPAWVVLFGLVAATRLRSRQNRGRPCV